MLMINIANERDEEQRKEKLRVDELCRNARICGRTGMSLDNVMRNFKKHEDLGVIAKVSEAYGTGADARERAEKSRARPSLIRRFYNRLKEVLHG